MAIIIVRVGGSRASVPMIGSLGTKSSILCSHSLMGCGLRTCVASSVVWSRKRHEIHWLERGPDRRECDNHTTRSEH